MNLFNCKISYLAQDENSGKIKKKTDIYEVEATGFTDAMIRLYQAIEPIIADYELLAMKKSNIDEVIIDDIKELFFVVKTAMITFDQETGKELKSTNNLLVQANSVEDAIKKINERLKDSMADYTIKSVTETKILDIFLN
jgi:hypothetical protein